MKTIKIITALAILITLIAAPGCNKTGIGERKHYAAAPAPEGRKDMGGMAYGPAHGGTTPPNAAAYDAMFFETNGVNPFIDTEDDKLSTFAIDVDTASYTVTRSYIVGGDLPPKEAVRTEEFVNYFKYNYRAPDGEAFSISMEGAPSKFGDENYKMLRIGIRGKDIKAENRKRAILTFVIDVSGSMSREDRLGLVKKSLKLLVDRMKEGDKIAIAVYGTNGHALIGHTGIEDRGKILKAIEMLVPEGSTNAEEGLEIGYKLADEAFEADAINRIILCSDGVANVGETGADGILSKIEKYKDKGIYLTTVGFGMGNYNDVLMEKLADKGNGAYAYVDTLNEARRLFIENLTGTLQTIAKDVKIQVEFNPDVVARYRLLGYENRDIADEDFRNDKVDAGEIGAGHQVTALYEIKFQKGVESGKAATVRVRYKNPDKSDEVSEVARDFEMGGFAQTFDAASADMKLAAGVAEFAEILRQSYWAKGAKIQPVLDLLHSLPDEYRKNSDVVELIDMVGKAAKMKTDESPAQ